MKFDSKVIEHINEVSKIDPENAQHMFDLYMKGMAGDSTASAEYVTSGLSGSASSESEISTATDCATTHFRPELDVIEERVDGAIHEIEKLKDASDRCNATIDACIRRLDSLNKHIDELTYVSRALVLLKKDSLESTAALMTVLEGYLDEDIVNEKDIMEKLYERIKEIKKTPMFKEMKHRIAEYKEERDED